MSEEIQELEAVEEIDDKDLAEDVVSRLRNWLARRR